MKSIRIIPLLISLGVCFTATAIGSSVTFPAITNWYPQLAKPFFSPPNWIFGPVWTVLYLMMGISLYLVVVKRIKESKKRPAYTAFATQLALNTIWSLLFFGLHSPFFALVEIVVLWAAILYTIKTFYPLSKGASWLLIPYLAWVSFASLLNFWIVLLN